MHVKCKYIAVYLYIRECVCMCVTIKFKMLRAGRQAGWRAREELQLRPSLKCVWSSISSAWRDLSLSFARPSTDGVRPTPVWSVVWFTQSLLIEMLISATKNAFTVTSSV